MTTKFYQVGGSVRDEILGIKSKDIDYAVEAGSFDELREAIIARGGTIFLETPSYLTIRAKVPSLGACDFVLCRKDGHYSDGRHPEEVTPGTIYDDLARRDFTMNAVAKTEDGTYLDPHGGIADIEKRLIRCVGKPEDRFSEDGLRMLRAFRFMITKNFHIDWNISTLFHDKWFIEKHMTGVSTERVREELHKCFVKDTYETLEWLRVWPHLMKYLFTSSHLWLKPTLESK